jgi:hypothetical protein
MNASDAARRHNIGSLLGVDGCNVEAFSGFGQYAGEGELEDTKRSRGGVYVAQTPLKLRRGRWFYQTYVRIEAIGVGNLN